MNVVLSGYGIGQAIYTGTRTLVYRGQRESDARSVVIKFLRNAYPTFTELLQFRNQYTIAKNLNIPGIIRPESLEPHGNSYALVMADFGSISLREYTQTHDLELTEILLVALQLTEILHGLYQHRVIHKDIKPANILIHPETKQIQLIDFSIASLLPKETEEVKHPNVLEGTLAYLAPEQTGRMNRGIDYRTDFYALGVTLFELLAGELPFRSDDPMELVHCHIAKPAPNLCELKPEIPQVISQIAAKLMAKNAEERYQSALGLKHDLETCLYRLKETGKIEVFEIGTRDLCDRFIIPEKLYGRETEVQQLLDAFERVSQGTSEFMLVAGFSGIGKTAVVSEVHKPITRQRGYFIKGKFDQFNRNIPFSAFLQAFRNLIGQLVAQSDTQLQQWKTQILEALGENSQVLIELIPELELIVGKQPPAPELSGSAAQNRFNLLFSNFIRVFANAEHPLVMFVDDLQWADSASLNLLKLLMQDTEYLLILGAYRDNEVFGVHPLMLAIDEMVKTGTTVNTITLQPLKLADLNQLVADTLSCARSLAQPLTDLVYQKTKGNPFFATQFLKALYEEGEIRFDGKIRHWQCDIARIKALALTDDVVEFMALQLQKLPDETQNTIKLAACIGAQFDLNTLAIVSEQSSVDAATALWKALQEGLIIPNTEVYKFFIETDSVVVADTVANPTYRFLHDRVQQAAYSLIAVDQQQSTHLTIGQLLLQSIPEAELETNIFEVVNHWNQAKSLLQTETERVQLIHLNSIAGRKAKTSAAYAAALEYFNLGISLLPEDCWQTDYRQTLALYENAAESAYGCGALEQMEHHLDAGLGATKSILDCIKSYEIRIQAYTGQGRFADAITTGIIALKQLGLELPIAPTEENVQQTVQEVLILLDRKSTDDLLNLPTTDKAEPLAILTILSAIVSACYLSGSMLFSLAILEQVRTTVQQGNTTFAAYAYSCYTILLNGFLNDLEATHQFGQLALKLQAKFNAKSMQTKINAIVGIFALPFKSHLQETLPLHLAGFQAGLEAGDLEFAGYNAIDICQCTYLLTKSLVEAEQEHETYITLLTKLGVLTSANYIQAHLQPIQRLLGQHSQLELDAQAKHLQTTFTDSHDIAGFWFYWIHQLVVSYVLQDTVQMTANAACARQYLKAGAGQLLEQIFYFYDSLTALSTYADAVDRLALLERVNENQSKLRLRADHAPMNFQHKYDLVEAERHRVLAQPYAAMELYDRAISGAKANGYLQEEALANELAAKFYLAWAKEKVAAGYMQEAYYCYAKWGAKAKTDELENHYADLLRPIFQQAAPTLNPLETLASFISPHLSIHTSTSTRSFSSSINTVLDFASILKACQAISSTIQLEELLCQLTQIILQNSGADLCALILPNLNQEWQVRAIATPESTKLCTELLDNNPHFPVKLIQYVKNTQSAAVIDELKTDIPVICEYLNQQQPQSVMCLPILNQGQLRGILYLENRVTSGTFASDRILILNFLCTQAAISLENARLYQQSQTALLELQHSQQLLRNIIDTIPQVIFWKDRKSNYLGCNQRFATMAGLPSPEAIAGKTDYDLPWTEAESDSYREYDRQVMEANRPQLHIIETQQQTDGTTLWLDTNKVPLRDRNGEVYGILGSYEDITDRKRAEETILQKSQELETALIELQNAQLQIVQSEKMASLGNLVAGVAHEINNPLGFLNGSINNDKDCVQDLLEHLALYQQQYPSPVAPIQDHAAEIDLEFLCEDLPALLNSMQGATDRIKNISTSLRTFSRADTEHQVSANLHEGIDSTLLILKYRLKANQFRPAIKVMQNYGDLPSIECFPGQLNQVFMNILANAIDMFDEMAKTQSFAEIEAHPQKIEICTARIENRVQIQIRDNGKGMTEGVKSKIFDHLFTTKPVGKGTGLGLAIARQIVVEKHGGKIEVDSVLGQGTKFEIVLPIAP
ncbi:MAG: AAA family ATPase [Oscillatoriaceae cyanobacterium Prado104]|jgi:PAS domain S-box-containing protein|nr:AAA family ATPase [Oscillatoriaceae cyanobacterium Prado104]